MIEKGNSLARNPVQFQKGISLSVFLSLYGTEDQCFRPVSMAMAQWVSVPALWPIRPMLPTQQPQAPTVQCCHRQTSITAGTIFDSTKLPLTVWFQAIYLMTQDKKGVSAMKLHRHLGISYNAAWRIRHKLMQVMMERDREHPLSGWIQLDDAYLGGERSGGKRGRGAPGDALCRRRETNKQGHPLRMKLTVVEGFRLTEIAAWGSSTSVNSGRLRLLSWRQRRAAFMSRWWWAAGEPASCRAPRVSMGEYDSRQHQERLARHLPRLPKIAQRYLSEFEYRFNRRFDLPDIMGDLSTWRSGRRRCRNGYSSYA